MAGEIFDDVVSIRRDIHAHPELAFEEERTAGIVASYLQQLGLDVKTGVAKTGVVALVEGGAGEGPTLALRADMDALPIKEANEVDYASQHVGKMHACGHDVHTSSLLGTAKILAQIKDQLPGRVKLIFQPSEEVAPGGASVMIKEGALKQPDVQAIYGQHVMPYMDVGTIGVRGGQYMASADELYITIRGKGGHGAHPYACVDPIAIGAQLVTALQQVVSRKADPRIPSVLTIGHFVAGGATNIIPEQVEIMGTFRTYNEEWRYQAHTHIERIARSTVEGLGGELDFELVVGYPVLHNDERLYGMAKKHITDYVGAERVQELDLWPAAEDFAYYTHEVPGFFYRLGTRNEAKGLVHGLHTPRFNIDEEALRLSTGLMAWLAVQSLAEGLPLAS